MKQPLSYKSGAFQNLNHTPMLTEGVSYSKLLWDFFFLNKT